MGNDVLSPGWISNSGRKEPESVFKNSVGLVFVLLGTLSFTTMNNVPINTDEIWHSSEIYCYQISGMCYLSSSLNTSYYKPSSR